MTRQPQPALDIDHDRQAQRLAAFGAELRDLTTYQGCSSLAGRTIDLYSLGSGRTVVEAGRSRTQSPVQVQDVTAQHAACDAAGGTLDQGDGWWLVKEADGFYRHRRGVVRDPAIYHRARQAEHDAAWLASGPHRCGECGIEMPAGHYGREKRYCTGHGARPPRHAVLTREDVTARRLAYNQRRNEKRRADKERAAGMGEAGDGTKQRESGEAA